MTQQANQLLSQNFWLNPLKKGTLKINIRGFAERRTFIGSDERMLSREQSVDLRDASRNADGRLVVPLAAGRAVAPYPMLAAARRRDRRAVRWPAPWASCPVGHRWPPAGRSVGRTWAGWPKARKGAKSRSAGRLTDGIATLRKLRLLLRKSLSERTRRHLT